MLFFFFKQKTAYEMRISDWSSDVCSSDLGGAGAADALVDLGEGMHRHVAGPGQFLPRGQDLDLRLGAVAPDDLPDARGLGGRRQPGRSEERRVGNARVSTSRARWSP